MSRRDRCLALLVAVLWGCNVVAIDVGLDHFPPLFFAALRFAVIAVPTVLFVPRPAVAWRWILGYGLGFGVVQFAFLFVAMDIGMPAGLASLVLQSSAPFTVLLGVLILRERVSTRQIAGLCIALAGLGSVGATRLEESASVLPVVLTLLAGLGWAVGSVCSRLAATDDSFRLVLWMCVVPPLPLLALSALVEGRDAGWASLMSVFAGQAWPGVAALMYIVVPTTLLGSALWSALLRRHPAGVVGVYSLAVPVAGILSSWALLDEIPRRFDLVASAVVVLGLLLSTPSGADRRDTAAGAEVGTAVVPARVAQPKASEPVAARLRPGRQRRGQDLRRGP